VAIISGLMPWLRLLLVLLLTGAGACSLGSAAPPPVEYTGDATAGVPASWLRPCWLPGVRRQAFCGNYEVFEDRAARRGRRIPLAVAYLPARSATPAPDPVFFLDGGPGNAATEAAAEIVKLLGPVLEDRPLVLVDQRGTGGSNPLSCDFGKRPAEPELFALDQVRACREKLSRQADLTLYTTPIAMADLDEVRAALGFERINLLGASYGTSAAQVYLRAHPDRVRSLVFLAPGPIDLRYPLFAARDVQRALDLLFDDCAADPACAAAFPNLRKDFAAVVARLERGPVRVALPPVASGSGSGRPEEIVLSLDLLRLTLPYRLYSTDAAARVPLALHRAARGDFTALARASHTIWRQTWAAPSQGLYLSVSCSEDVALLDPRAAPPVRPEPDPPVAEATRDTFVGDLRIRLHRSRCAAWPRGTLPPGYWEPVRADTPALLLAGQLDPILPPVWAEEVARHLPNSRLVVVPQASHWPVTPCTRGLIREFLAAGSAAGLDTSCVKATRRPPFELR
jgi:pimeloyl-ACP methyl ester carboxylesterase